MSNVNTPNHAVCTTLELAFSANWIMRCTKCCEISEAIATGEITLYYQPIVCLETGAIAGYEALSRWECHGDVLLPVAFLDQIIGTPNEKVWLRSQLRQVQAAFAEIESWQFISLNLSRESLVWVDLLEILREEHHGGDLWLEIPESASLDAEQQEIQTLSILKHAGFPLEVDDFGAREAGFRRFLTGLFSGIKLDWQLVSQCHEDSDKGRYKRALIAAMVGLCRELGMSLITEGLSNQSEADCCRALGVRLGQGFLWGMPQPQPQKKAPTTGASS